MQGGSVSVASQRPALAAAEPLERRSASTGDEINLVAVVLLLWARRWWLLAAIAIGSAAALVYGFTTPPTWRAEVVTTQVNEQSMGGAAASIANQLGGLMSLTNLGVGADRNAQDYQAVLESRHLLQEFITRNDLIPRLSSDPRRPLTLWRAVQLLEKGVVSIRQDPRRGTTTLAVQWTDAATAANWANGLVALANELIRTRALADARRNIAYLTSQAERATDVDLRHVIFNLIENETKTEMLANGRADYAFRIVDPATPPEFRAAPHRTLLLICGFLLGAVLGGMAILGWDWVQRQRERLRRGSMP